MNIGFTGTRNGMTPAQRSALTGLLRDLAKYATVHHGDCVGADAEFHDICGRLNFVRVVHPPVDHTHRARVFGADETRGAKTHFARNRDIVEESDLLIATPWQETRPAAKTGGGTWYTVEYAEKRLRRVFVVWPDGRITHSDGTPSLYGRPAPTAKEANRHA